MIVLTFSLTLLRDKATRPPFQSSLPKPAPSGDVNEQERDTGRPSDWGWRRAGKPTPEGPTQRYHISVLRSLWRRMLTFSLCRFPHGISGLDGREAFMEVVTAYALAHRRRFRLVFSKLITAPLQFCQNHILSILLFIDVI